MDGVEGGENALQSESRIGSGCAAQALRISRSGKCRFEV